MKKLLLALLVLVPFSLAIASDEPHPTEYILGAGFNMTKTNDIIVGTYNAIPFWAEKKCGSHIRGIYKKEDAIKEFSVVLNQGKLEGVFGNVAISFVKFDKENRNITLNVNGAEVVVHFEYVSFADGHFKNITFTFGNGFTVALMGEACGGSTMFYAIFLVGVTLL